MRTTLNDFIASWQQAPRVNAQTGTTYAFVAADYGYLVTFSNGSAIAVTLPQATGSFATWNVMACNKNTGTVTITPTTSTINGAATLTLSQNQCYLIISDGANYQVFAGGSGVGTITNAMLATMATGTIKSNITAGTATPADNTLSAIFDSLLGSTQGSIIYRGLATWTGLGPGTAGQLLSTNGAGANPSWLTASGTGTVTSLTAGAGLTGGTITTAGTIASAFDPGSITNCTLAGTVSGNNLTLAIKTQAAADPSATSPCVISFRNATAATGDYTAVSVTAATSLTINANSTLGTSNSTPFRLWLTAWNNAGTVVLGVSNQSNSTNVFPLNEGTVQSSTACSACTNATSAGVFYTTAAQTSKAIRILGYMEWASGLATAGTWSSGPTTIQMFGPGVKKPSDPVQTVLFTTTSASTTTSTSYQATNLTASITPTSAASKIKITFSGAGGWTNSAGFSLFAIYRTNCSGTIVSSQQTFGLSSTMNMFATVSGTVIDAPASASAVTYVLCERTTSASNTASFLNSGQGDVGVMTLQEIAP